MDHRDGGGGEREGPTDFQISRTLDITPHATLKERRSTYCLSRGLRLEPSPWPGTLTALQHHMQQQTLFVFSLALGGGGAAAGRHLLCESTIDVPLCFRRGIYSYKPPLKGDDSGKAHSPVGRRGAEVERLGSAGRSEERTCCCCCCCCKVRLAFSDVY